MIYLDNAATTKPCAQAIEAVKQSLSSEFFNPSALYYPAVQVKTQIEEARAALACKLRCKPSEIYFTSGATEANNWAITSGFRNKRGNIVITEGEHPSVYEVAAALKSKGADVRTAPLNSVGQVDEEKLMNLVDEQTALVSIIHVSNETGAVNDIFRLSDSIKRKSPKAVVHSDGVQAFCKIPTALGGRNIDLYTVSAHKIGGVKGIGALYMRSGINMSPMIYGGGQEKNLRSGTENVAGILSFGAAVNNFDTENIDKLYDYTIERLTKISDIRINGAKESSSKFIISVGVSGVKSEVLQHMLSDEGVLTGLGSACSSKKKKNRILESMKVPQKFIEGNIRLSFSTDTTLEDLAVALDALEKNIDTLRRKING